MCIRDSGCRGVQVTGEVSINAGIHEDARHVGGRRNLCQDESGVLEVEQRLTEHLPVLGVGDGHREGRLHHGHGVDGDEQSLLRQLRHELSEALAGYSPEDVGGGHAHPLEEELGGVRPVPVSYTHLDVYKRQPDPDVEPPWGAPLSVEPGASPAHDVPPELDVPSESVTTRIPVPGEAKATAADDLVLDPSLEPDELAGPMAGRPDAVTMALR